MIKRTLVALTLVLGATIALPISAQAATDGWCYDKSVSGTDVCRRY
jgi:hypothetical protein